MTRQQRKRLEWQQEQEEQEQLENHVPVVEKALPGDGGKELRELLLFKTTLQEHLQSFQKRPVLVGVDVVDERWVFVVRGCKPVISFWAGYPIYWTKSGAVGARTQGI